MPCVRSFVLESCTVQCTGDMPLRVAPYSHARPMACARRRPAQRFSLSRSIVPPYQLLLTIAHQLLPSGSLCNLALHPRSFRGVCFSVRLPPPSRSLPPRRSRCRWRVPSRVANLCRWSLRCSLSFHSALCNLLISLKPPLIRSPQITVLAAVS